MTGATGNWYCGLHEYKEMGFVLHVLRSEDCFLDVGANIGSYTVLAAGAVCAQTIAVEPIPATFEHLCRNVQLNGLGAKVRCVQMGLSDQVTKLHFTDSLDSVNHVMVPGESHSGIDVAVMTLDELVGEVIPAIIKIDVEGHELSVLRGASRVLADERLLAAIIETNGSGSRYNIDDDELFNVMLKYGFRAYGYDPLARRLDDGGSITGNTIFIRNIENVISRIETARTFKLINGSI